MWVVKLGGSLAADSETLPCWLESLAATRVAIVPGGGVFADAVRETQRRWHFQDATAHAMAILAMAQYGLMLHGLEPRLRTCRRPTQIPSLLACGRSVVWLPDPQTISVPESWAVTSDSLALWLAQRIGATHVVLVKSAEIPSTCVTTAALQSVDLVDAAFPRFLAAGNATCWLCHRDQHLDFLHGLTNPDRIFTRIVRDEPPAAIRYTERVFPSAHAPGPAFPGSAADRSETAASQAVGSSGGISS
jgi:aspartokinase-like uncharacterized kinase